MLWWAGVGCSAANRKMNGASQPQLIVVLKLVTEIKCLLMSEFDDEKTGISQYSSQTKMDK
jgi:hypothetical protein